MNPVVRNLLEASISAILPAALACIFVAVARWRGKLLTATFEHALWTCVLAAMLAFALPKITFRAGTPTAAPAALILPHARPTALIVTPSDTFPVVIRYDSRPTPWLLLIWLSGSAFMLLRIGLGWYLTRRGLAGARSVLGESIIRHALDGHAGIIGGLDESTNTVVPCTVEWPYSRIILPLAWRTWTPEKILAVVGHEVAHVHRRDLLVHYFSALNKAIFWFHPLSWWLDRRLSELAEFAADEAAVSATSDPHSYAEVLIEIASIARPVPLRWASASVDFARSGFVRINRRVTRILDSRRRSGPMKLVWAAAVVMMALALVRFERPLRAQVLVNPLNNWPASAERFRDVLEYLVNVEGPFATKLTAEQAGADEQHLAANPEDEKARLELSVYYFTNSQAQSRLHLVNWMIDHHPDSALHALLSMTVSPTRDGSGPYMDAVDRWHAQLAAHPKDANVLLNAAKAIGQSSPSDEIALLKNGQSLDHDRFTGLLAQYYAGVLQSPPGLRVAAQSAVRADLAISTDAALLGSTGALLSERAILAASMHRPSYDLESIRALSLDLLARAQALDPANRKWPDAAEGARRLTVSPDTVAVTSPPGTPTRIRIGAGVAKANLITAPEPQKSGIEGKVDFQIVIGKDGHITQATLISGPPTLVQQAQAAVSQYVYKPTLLNGIPVEVQTTVEIVF